MAWMSTRPAASATGRPPGSRLGRQPASTAPRSPARRGIQASRAPVRSASLRTALRVPGTIAARSPTRMIASRSRSSLPIRSSVAGSSPGTVGIRVAPCLRAPLPRYGARVQDFRPCFRYALRSRRKIDAGLVLGLQSDQQHTGCRLQVGVRHGVTASV